MRVARYLTGLVTLLWASAAAAIPPNIILVLVDDLPTKVISAYDGDGLGATSGWSTPNLDAIAAAGVKFTNGVYMSAQCTPSRVQVYTGLPPWKSQVYENDDRFDDSIATIMDSMGPGGPGAIDYDTEVIGKWQVLNQVGSLSAASLGWTYTDICVQAECTGDYTDAEFQQSATCPADGDPTVCEGNVTDVITAKGIDRLNARVAGTPKFLTLSYKATHAAWVASATELGDLDATTVPEPATFNDHRRGRAAHVWDWGNSMLDLFTQWTTPPFSTTYGKPQPGAGVDTDAERRSFVYLEAGRDTLETAATLDRNFGELMTYLTTEHLDPGELNDGVGTDTLIESTVIIFMSDNSNLHGEHDMYSKYRFYDEATNMSLLMRGPAATGIIPGSTRTQFISSLDVAPTILNFAGIATPANMEGRSLHDLYPASPTGAAWKTGAYVMIGQRPESEPEHRHEGYVTATHKLIHHFTESGSTMPEWELIDRVGDPNELVNIYPTANASTILSLKAAMQAERVDLGLPSFLDMATASSAGGLMP